MYDSIKLYNKEQRSGDEDPSVFCFRDAKYKSEASCKPIKHSHMCKQRACL